MLALLEQYPRLTGAFPRVPLTLVEPLPKLGAAMQAPQLYVKRDDLTGRRYGGNKVRALEFLLGEALAAGHSHVMALGFPASYQALAQAVHAGEAGLQSTAFLFPQVPSAQARQHVLIYQSLQADIRPTLPKLLPFPFQHRVRYGRLPKLLEASSPIGMPGYVSAGFELKQHLERGLIPEPDRIYLSLATMGTMVGLMLGLKAANVQSQVIGVDHGGHILGRKVATPARMTRLFAETQALLRAQEPAFPQVEVSDRDVIIRPG